MSNTLRIRSAFVAGLLCTTSAFAHTDDPKVRDVLPRFEGVGWSRGGESAESGLPTLFPGSGVMLESWLTVADFGPAQSWGNDCWGYVSPSGREYALMGLSDGTGVVEITDPTNPVLLTVIPAPHSTWRDIKTYQTYAYIVTEAGSGIQVVDLSQIDSGIVGAPVSFTDGGSSASHNVVINTDSGFLYRAGGGGNGLRIYDLSTPATPVYVSSWPDRYVHDCQVVSYSSGPYAGKEIAFAFGGYNNGWLNPGVAVIDVTDKQNLVELDFLEYANAEYSHQGWLSMDKQTLYVGDELNESNLGLTSTTHIIDVSDLSSITEVGTFTNGNAATTHNLYVKGDMIFAANYSSGVRMFDVSNPSVPSEVAYFDTAPLDDGTNYNGLWSNYPYFPSGTVIGSDRQRGLFVWSITIDMPADITGEGWVNIDDLLGVLGSWGPCPAAPNPCHADVDKSGTVGVEDLLEVLADWS